MTEERPELRKKDAPQRNDVDPFIGWKRFTNALSAAGEQMDAATQNLSSDIFHGQSGLSLLGGRYRFESTV